MRRNNRFNVQRIALCGLLTAMMLVLGFIESLIPVAAGVPGIKLGLSNGVLMFALYMLDAPTDFILMILKVVLSGLMLGGVSAMLYAMSGGVLSILTMILLKRFGFHIIVVSMFGAVMHNVGQVLMAMLVVNQPRLLYYMAVLMIVGLGTGAVTGVAANTTIKHIKKLRLSPGKRNIKVECAYCHSTNVTKISSSSRAFSVAFFHLASSKLGKQWHCNDCNSDF